MHLCYFFPNILLSTFRLLDTRERALGFAAVFCVPVAASLLTCVCTAIAALFFAAPPSAVFATALSFVTVGASGRAHV